MRGVVFIAATLLAAVAADIPGGFTFSIPDGHGRIIAATSAAGNLEASVIIVAADTPNIIINQAGIGKSHGYVTCGCVLQADGGTFFYGGLSEVGEVLRVDLSFPSVNTTVKILNASDPNILWNGEEPLQMISAVCQGSHVYFGTRASTASTVIRLDTRDTNPSSRFFSMGQIGPGDLAHAVVWGDDAVLFAMEPSGAVPLSFFVVNTTGAFPAVTATKSAPASLASFDTLSDLAADHLSQRVVVTNGNGVGRVAVLDLSGPATASVEEELVLDDVGSYPITSFIVDEEARYGYALAGDCDASDVLMVAVRLVPTITRENATRLDSALYDCKRDGVPAAAVLISAGDDRSVLIFTEVSYTPGHNMSSGRAVSFPGYPARPCPLNCNEAAGQGECAGGQCYCGPAWTGDACQHALPCAGTACNNRGTCTDGVCHCNKGYKGDYCEAVKTCTQDCSGRGDCVQGDCVCAEGFGGDYCQFRAVGCASLSDCSDHGTCRLGYPMGSCACYPGYSGMDCSILDVTCASNCSNHGVCVDGKCVCDAEWQGKNCSERVVACMNNCSSHGICRNGRCTCYKAYKGLDCSQPAVAPSCDPPCSPHGRCVDAVCVCSPAFTGPACDRLALSTMTPLAASSLRAGENVAVASFAVDDKEVVVCLATTPAKCVGLDPVLLSRRREAVLDASAPARAAGASSQMMLLESGEGREEEVVSHPTAARALMPEIAEALSSVSLVEIAAAAANQRPVTVAVKDPAGAFVILGTGVSVGSANGELLKMSTATLQVTASLQLTDDLGRGVTAAVAAGDGTFFFASGNAPATIYRVDANLVILSRTTGPAEDIRVLLYDGAEFLLAATATHAYVYQVIGNLVRPSAGTPSLTLSSAGSVTCGALSSVNGSVNAVFGLDTSPAQVVKVAITHDGPSVAATLTLGNGEDHITAVALVGNNAYFAMGPDTAATCLVARVAVSSLTEGDITPITDCDGPLVSASVSTAGHIAFFGSAASPASVYAVKVSDKVGCPQSCNGHGDCVENLCACREGWGGLSCAAAPPCPRDCSGNGVCSLGVCTCAAAYTGLDCSARKPCRSLCGHGQCSGTNHTQWPCVCDSGWRGDACDSAACPGDCSGHGSCVGGICSCAAGYGGLDCADAVCQADADCAAAQTCDKGVCKSQSGGSSSSISPYLIGAAAGVAGMVAVVGLVAVFKAWSRGDASLPTVSDVASPLLDPKVPFTADSELEQGRSRISTSPGDGYSRIPRRLIK